MELALPVAMAISIGLIHFFGEEIDEYLAGYSFFLASLSAGFTVSYFFIRLIPETMSNAYLTLNNIFVVAGFTSLYVVEEVVYEREEVFGDIREGFKEVQTALLSFYHLVVGMLLGFLSKQSSHELLLFYLPVLIHTAVNSLAVKEMHEEMLDNVYIKIFASFSTLGGVLLINLVSMPQKMLFSILGIVGGAFIYVVVHDALDPRKERPIGFVCGVTVFLFIIVLI